VDPEAINNTSDTAITLGGASQTEGTSKPFLEMTRISKSFSGVQANDQITFQVLPAEVHALLGENGAGKSTLMNILYGLLSPDEGEITVRGHKVVFTSPGDAIRHRIGMVHQHFTLVPTLTVAENIALGLKSTRGPVLRYKLILQKIKDLARICGIPVDPQELVGNLSVGAQQRVEILKALCRGAELIVMDEPTAVLTPTEARELFNILRQLKAEGRSIVLISHKLDEVLEISDRITVLRDGRVVGRIETRNTDRKLLARMMVGREVSLEFQRPPPPATKANMLEVRGLVAKGHPGLRGVTFSLAGGEILGIAGVDGNGQTELAHVIAGLSQVEQGGVYVDGNDFTRLSSKERSRRGLAYIPEDRQAMGVILDFTIAENIVLRGFRDFTRFGFLKSSLIASHTRTLCERFAVKTPSIASEIRKLSGGNQQKVVLAREISSEPSVVLAVHPTRGLDVGATEYVLKSMLELRARGTAILYISGELEEIFAICDRIAVMFEGQILDIISGSSADVEQIGLLMGGSTENAMSTQEPS
jgi:simple sugar transport system ATP-binding protein